MPTTRTNPVDGLLDVFHDDTNTWVRAAALLQLATGLNVNLSGDQEVKLSALAAEITKLSTLLAEVQNARNTISQLGATADQIKVQIQNDVAPALDGVATNVASLEIVETNVLARLDAIRTYLINTVQPSIASIDSKTLNYTAKLDAIIAAVGTMTAAVNGIKAPSTPTLYRVVLDTANLEVRRVLPQDTKTLSFKCRKATNGDAFDIRYAFVADQVGNVAAGNYRTLEAFNEYSERLGQFSGSLFFASSAANTTNQIVIEVEVWT